MVFIQELFSLSETRPIITQAWNGVVNKILINAVYNGSHELVRFALTNGATPNTIRVNTYQKRIFEEGDDIRLTTTLLDVASEFGNKAIVEELVNNGVHFETDIRAIEMAVCRGHIELLEYFKEKGFDFNIEVRPDCTFSQDMLTTYFMDGHDDGLERSFRWLFTYNFIKVEDMVDMSDPPTIAYLMYTHGYDMSFTESPLINIAIANDSANNEADFDNESSSNSDVDILD